jgi:aldose 1-epimerase
MMKTFMNGLILAGAAAFLAACSQSGDNEPPAVVTESVAVQETPFGVTADGQEVTKYTLTNANGMQVEIMNYGGIILSLKAPDRDGQLEDIVLGYDTLAEYEAETPYFGALIGRYGNRIARGRFKLDGQEYTLATNNDPNHLHGGDRGFDKVVWEARSPGPDTGGNPTLWLSYVSEDGEEGYPGTLRSEVRYELTDENALVIHYRAETDAPTPVNLTQHTYFNLSGNAKRDILDHKLHINADRYTPVDATLIPTGELAPVSGTPFDFREAKAIGLEIDDEDEQLGFGLGYDHNWVVNQQAPGEMGYVATLSDTESGRMLEIHSTEPGLQFYSGNFLDGSLSGKGGVRYEHRWGLCLETQHFPDSPNQPAFPSTILRPGEIYDTRTVWQFSVAE